MRFPLLDFHSAVSEPAAYGHPLCLNLRTNDNIHTFIFRVGFLLLGRHLRCGKNPTRRITPKLGLLSLGGSRSLLRVGSLIWEMHPICRWVVPSLQATLMQVQTWRRPHEIRYIMRVSLMGLSPQHTGPCGCTPNRTPRSEMIGNMF